MKIAFIAYESTDNIKAWSGTIHYMAKYISKGNDIIKIDNLTRPIDYVFKISSGLLRLTGRSSDYKKNTYYVKIVCHRIQKKLNKLDYDLIFAPSSTYITFIKSKKPIVIWADATFKDLVDSHFQYSNLSKRQIRVGNKLEHTAFENSSKIVFSSQLPAKSAISEYNIDKSKVSIIPFGANLNQINSESDILKFNELKDKNTVRLLFIGVYWYNKGGDILLNIFHELRKLSSTYELEIVGSSPENIQEFDGVTFHGFLDKSNQQQNKKLEDMFKSSHYFILPTRSEAFGISFVEANSYGLPAFGSNLGGVPDIIKNGINGELIDIEKSPKDLALQIHNYISNGKYEKKSLMAFNHYIDNFTWDKSFEKLNIIFKELTTKK